MLRNSFPDFFRATNVVKLFLMYIDQIKPERSITKLGNRHVILIHGDADTTVPVSEFYHLRQAGGANIVDSWVLPDVTHAAAFQKQKTEYLERVVKFFRQELN